MNKSHTYFENLNYTMSNEDTSFEYGILKNETEHVLCIAGSGSRVLPLFAKAPKIISICDFSLEQLALTATRIATVKELNYEQFLAFWGYPGVKSIFNNQRKSQFEALKIPDEYKTVMMKIFESHQWGPLLYQGRYERTLIKMSSFIQRTLGKKHIKKLQNFDHHGEFLEYLENDFPKFKWKMVVTLLGNSTVLNALLYKGKLPKKNIKMTHAAYYKKIFQNLFKQYTPKDSFFLQLLFFGQVTELKGAPLETDFNIFDQMKNGVKNCEIKFYRGDLFSYIEKFDKNIDFVSFSDILSYFPKDLEDIYLQKIKKKLSPNAITVHRYYLHISRNLDTCGYSKITSKYQSEINREKTQIYDIDVYIRDEND